MPRKISRKGLIKKLDAVCKEIIFKRDNNTCVTCGSQNPTWSHVFSRRTYSTRWDMKNCHVQCWPCYFKHVRNQYPYFEWFRNKYGSRELEKLHRKFNTTKRWTMLDLENKLKQLNEALNSMP